MSILYIEGKIKEKKEKQELLDALASIGLTAADLPELTEKGKEIILRECQDWVKKKFFTDDILSPKFGERKEYDN